MTLKYLPEHAQANLLALDLARKEASHLRYSLQQATRQAAAAATSLAQRIHSRLAPLHAVMHSLCRHCNRCVQHRYSVALLHQLTLLTRYPRDFEAINEINA